jgi:hypothetical protein
MWLIIPNHTQEDIDNWVFSDATVLGTGVYLNDSGWSFKHRSNSEKGRNKLVGCHALILNPLSRGVHPALDLSPILKEVDRVWVHFGSTNLEQMSVSWINEQWQLRQTRLNFDNKVQAEKVMPMSQSGGVPWQIFIKSFNDVMNEGIRKKGAPIPLALDPLEQAWKCAERHFFKYLQQDVIEKLFPFYVDICNFHSMKNCSDVDLQAACRDAFRVVDSHKTNVFFERFSEAIDAARQKEFTVFVELYKRSSDEYTNMLQSYKIADKKSAESGNT